MASISKLSIRGIRSFSPNDEEQVIAFCFPLTIIVGANGCGKTTIIEALKYSVTGSLPPGNKSGQSFVHDPRSLGMSVVKANVKLRFNNRGNQSMVVIRSMEVTQKKSTASFKALDGIIRTQDPNTGERVSLSHKCTELDKQIPALMGVSKPILEHVVFCHQEDSSWPLQEGAVLKKRFDDIFDSTRYAKALEAIKASRKEYAAQVKDLKADLEGLKSHKHAASGFLEELENCKDQISQFDDEIQRCHEGMEKERETLAEASAVLAEIQQFDYEVDSKQQELERQEAVLASQKDMMGQDDMTGRYSYDELKTMLRELNDKQYGNQAMRELIDKEREIEEITRGLERSRNVANELNAKKGKLEAEKDAYNLLLKQRFKVMEEIHKAHGVECDLTQTQDDDTLTQGTAASRMSLSTLFTSGGTTLGEDITISQEDVEAFTRALTQKELSLKTKLNAAKERHRSDEDEMQKEIAELLAKLSAVESNKKRIEEAKREALRELEQVKSNMSSSYSRVRKADVEEARRQAADLAKSRDQFNNDPRREDIIREFKVLEDKLKSLSESIEQDTKIRDQLRSQSDAQAEIDMLEKQAAQEFDGLKDKIRENSGFLSANGEVVRVSEDDPVCPLQVVKDNIRQKYETAEREIDRCHKTVSDLRSKVTEKNALLTNHKGRLTQLRLKANQLDHEDGPVQKISRVVNALVREQRELVDEDEIYPESPPTEVIKFISKQINELGAVLKDEQISKVVKRIKKMSKIACPCCTRDFVSAAEYKAFQNRMAELADEDTSELIRVNQAKSKETAAVLSKLEVCSTTLIIYVGDRRFPTTSTRTTSLASKYAFGKHLQKAALNHLIFLFSINAEIRELETHIEAEGDAELNNLKTALEKEEATAGSKKGGIQSLAEPIRGVKNKKDELKRNLLGYVGNDSRDLKRVERDITESSVAKEKAYLEISKLNNEQKSLNEKISRIANQATAAEKNARDKEDSYNRDQIAMKRQDELNELLQKLAVEETSLDKSKHPLHAERLKKESNRDSMRRSNEIEESRLGDELRSFEKDALRLQEIVDKIDDYIRSNKEREMEQIESRLISNAGMIKEDEAKIERLKPEIDLLKKQVDDSERQKTKIQNNLDLIKLERRVNELTDEVAKMVDKRGLMGAEEAEMRCSKAKAKYNEYKENKTRTEGRKQGLDEQKRMLRRKLKEPEYHDVEERHRVKMIEHETTQIVVHDLDKYYDALDKALLRYHGMKINDINKIIRELWTLTYKGEDITNIQITSDQDSGGRATRSYNYRIVMSKGNTQMDMRGRCSAGQRVLASIVIRLALAETFCLNCGVMALDEPTTNLDYENKRGLAIALAQIIASRAAQSNFQLVVITHDEDFVSMMKQELSSQTGFNMPERYYQVSREQGHDGRFYSKIHAIDWDEL
eukprot:CCRYP_009209-RB/>CCRYP_009209-RB protein AED:0.12 eAED:0.11 QI:270/0.73/0.68/1/0.8/0.68/16/153/1414